MLGSQEITLAKLLRGFGDLIEGVGQRLDVFTLQRGDESFAEVFGKLLGNSFVLPAYFGKGIERLPLFGMLNQLNQRTDSGLCFFGAAFHQFKELVVFADNLLQ